MYTVGVRIRIGPRSTIHTYPFDEECPAGPERTSVETRGQARVATTTGKSVSHVCTCCNDHIHVKKLISLFYYASG